MTAAESHSQVRDYSEVLRLHVQLAGRLSDSQPHNNRTGLKGHTKCCGLDARVQTELWPGVCRAKTPDSVTSEMKKIIILKLQKTRFEQDSVFNRLLLFSGFGSRVLLRL